MKINLIVILLLAGSILSAQNALDFDGIDDDVTSAFGGPFGTADRTVECWIKTSNSIQTQQVIIDYGAMSPLGSRFTLNMINFGLLRIEVGGNGFNSTQSIADGKWHHVAVTYDDGAATKFRMYIDGQLETTQNTTVPVNTLSTGLFLGRRNDGVNFFDGAIDEVRVWNVVRTQTEIDSFKNQEFCVPPPGLTIYYQFNQGVAGGNNSGVTSLQNALGGNHGTLNNFALTGTTSNWVSGVSLSGSIMTSDTLDACDSLRSPSGKYLWTSSGVYYDTLQSSTGCDSIIMTNLTINVVDTTVMSNGVSLGAAMVGASYQWLDCDNNYAVVPGATSQNFAPTSAGNYAVQIDYQGCIDTSACFFAAPMALDENLPALWRVYPRPVNTGAVLSIEAISEGKLSYRLYNMSGKVVSSGKIRKQGAKFSLTMDIDPGIYMLQLIGDDGSYVYRIPVR